MTIDRAQATDSRVVSSPLWTLVWVVLPTALIRAKRALLPLENKRSFLDVPGDVVEHVDPIFYGDSRTAAMKAMGLS